MTDEIAIAAVSGIFGALLGSLLAWFAQTRIARAQRAWEMKLRAYSKYLEAVSDLSQAWRDDEVRRGRSSLTAAKGQIIVTGSVEAIEALQALDAFVGSSEKSWAANPLGRNLFAELVTAMRRDLGGGEEVIGAAESLLLGSSKP